LSLVDGNGSVDRRPDPVHRHVDAEIVDLSRMIVWMNSTDRIAG